MDAPPSSRGRRSSPSPPTVTPGERGAVRLAGELLQFDGFAEDALTFVSHAHVRVPSGAQRLITSVITARLLGGRARHALATPFGREFSLGALELSLLPTGHVPGAAALRVRHRRRSLIYAGQLGAYGERFGLDGARPEPCDTLVLDTPWAHPAYKLPAPEPTLKRLLKFCRQGLADDRTPVLLCKRLGLAQPLTAVLHDAGFSVFLHRSQHRFLGPLRELGLRLGPARRFEGRIPPGGVLLWPDRLHGSAALEAVGPRRMALVSALALVPGKAEEHGCDEAFALSTHADLPRVKAYVKQAAPRRIYLLEGCPAELAVALRQRGREVHRFGPSPLNLL